MNLVERAKAISLSPATTWPVIDAEKHDAQSLFVPYMLILAAIPAVAGFIGMTMIGVGGFGFSFKMPFVSGLGMMVTTYILSLVMTFVFGWLASTLAPTFGGQSNLEQGLKLAVFGGTPMMLAGVFNVLPALSFVGLLVALYSLYVMYLGLPVLMKNPKEKTIPYMVVLIIASIIGTPGQATITTPAGNAVITTTPAAPGTPTDSATMTIQTPKGEVKIDMKNMEAMAKQMEAMSKQMEQNKK